MDIKTRSLSYLMVILDRKEVGIADDILSQLDSGMYEREPVRAILSFVRTMHMGSKLEEITISFLLSLYDPDESSNKYEMYRRDLHHLPPHEKSKYSTITTHIYDLYRLYSWDNYTMKFYRTLNEREFTKTIVRLLIDIVSDNVPDRSKRIARREKKIEHLLSSRYETAAAPETSVQFLPIIELKDPGDKESAFTKLETLLSLPDNVEYYKNGGDRMSTYIIELLTQKYVVVPSDFNTVNNLVVLSLSHNRELIYNRLANLVDIIHTQTTYQENYIMDMYKQVETVDTDNYEVDVPDSSDPLDDLVSLVSEEYPDIEKIRDFLDERYDSSISSHSIILDEAIGIAAANNHDEVLELLCEY